jgi:hypothetical protein
LQRGTDWVLKKNSLRFLSKGLKNTDSVRVSGFRREVDKNYALLDYSTACSGKFLPTFRDKNWILDP